MAILLYIVGKNPVVCPYTSRRPWYVETATPMPKDLVIVLDRSGSMMEDNRQALARVAARTVIGTLNPNDRVSRLKSIIWCTSLEESH